MILHPALALAAVAPAAAGRLQDMLCNRPDLSRRHAGAVLLPVLRPQQQRAKEHQSQINAVKRGDTVVLSSGMIGKVVRVEDNELGIEIAQGVTVKVVKSMVSEVRTRGEPAAANDAKS